MRVVCLSMMVLVGAATASAAPPEVKFLFPAGGQRGQVVAVRAEGKFATWPPQVWVDRPGIEVSPQADKEKLSVTVAPDAAPGVYWIRLFDAEGAAPPRPFVVGLVPELVEQEPNNALAAAQRLSDVPSVIVNGQLARQGDVDTFLVTARAGQTLVADVDAETPLASPLDAVVQILSPEGFVIAQNDEHVALDPRLAVPIARDGDYAIRLFGFPATPDQSIALSGSSEYIYRLMAGTGPYVDFTLPLAVANGSSSVALHGWNLPPELSHLDLASDSAQRSRAIVHPLLANVIALPVVEGAALHAAESADPIKVPFPASVTAVIETPRDRDEYLLDLRAGEIVLARVEGRALGFDLDPVIELFDASGKSAARVDDLGNSRDAELSYTAPADGAVKVVVSDLHRSGGPRHLYRLTLTRGAPDFHLQCDTHQVVLAPGATVDLPVTVERRLGHAMPIVVTVAELPPGVIAAEAASQPGTDSAAKVTLKLTAAADAAPSARPVRIVGRDDQGESQLATFPAPGAQAELTALWLTITPAPAPK